MGDWGIGPQQAGMCTVGVQMHCLLFLQRVKTDPPIGVFRYVFKKTSEYRYPVEEFIESKSRVTLLCIVSLLM